MRKKKFSPLTDFMIDWLLRPVVLLVIVVVVLDAVF